VLAEMVAVVLAQREMQINQRVLEEQKELQTLEAVAVVALQTDTLILTMVLLVAQA
jgi:flagellar basal body rod protein FlgC